MNEKMQKMEPKTAKKNSQHYEKLYFQMERVPEGCQGQLEQA